MDRLGPYCFRMAYPPLAAPATVPAILTRTLAQLAVASLGALGSFYLLMPVIPANAAGTGAVLLTVLVPAWRERRRLPATRHDQK
jgi:hypothetical protein